MPQTPDTVVLLVQPDADSREMYAEFLRLHGILGVQISTARDGLAAAAKADVVVTDLLLPGDMDGIEFIRRLKEDERTKRVPIVVVTACAWVTDRARAEEAGCDVFLPMPCLPDELLRHVRRLLPAAKRRDARESRKKRLATDPKDAEEAIRGPR
jgi:two-component system phosphate regulon response regulator PhoB